MGRFQGQRHCDSRLGCGEMLYPIAGKKGGANCKINERCADQRLNVSRFERQGPFKEAARPCQILGS